jgi:hypothetical protein
MLKLGHTLHSKMMMMMMIAMIVKDEEEEEEDENDNECVPDEKKAKTSRKVVP